MYIHIYQNKFNFDFKYLRMVVMVTSGITTIPMTKSEIDNTRSKKLLGVRIRVQRLNGIMTRRFDANIEDDRMIDNIETITIPPILVSSLGTTEFCGFGDIVLCELIPEVEAFSSELV